MRLQFKSMTRKADSDKYVAMIHEELEIEESEECRHLGEGYIRLIKDVGSREALTRRFFLIFQYEEVRRGDGNDFSQILWHDADSRAKFPCLFSAVREYDSPTERPR